MCNKGYTIFPVWYKRFVTINGYSSNLHFRNNAAELGRFLVVESLLSSTAQGAHKHRRNPGQR